MNWTDIADERFGLLERSRWVEDQLDEIARALRCPVGKVVEAFERNVEKLKVVEEEIRKLKENNAKAN